MPPNLRTCSFPVKRIGLQAANIVHGKTTCGRHTSILLLLFELWNCVLRVVGMCLVIYLGSRTTVVIPVTHIPEISAENQCQKTSTINRQKKQSISYFLLEKFGTKLHVRRVRNRCRLCINAGFRRRFLVSVSWA